MPLADPHTLIDRVFAQGWSLPERLRIDEWAQRYRIVVGGPSPGPWLNADAPHMVEIMRIASDPATRKVFVAKSPQGAGTEGLINVAMAHIDQDPDTAGYFMDQKQTAADFVKTRLIPTFEATPRIARHLSVSPRETSQRAIIFNNGATLWILGAGSAGQLANKSMRRIYIDELDKYATEVRGRGKTEGSALSLARRRIDAYGAAGFEMAVSSPTDEGVGIDAEYGRSDKARRCYPCPVCGAWQVLRFGDGRSRGGIRFTAPGGESLGGGVLARASETELAVLAAHVKRTAWYECAVNGCAIHGSMKRSMMQRGRWIREGQRIDRPTNAIVGEPIDTGGIRGFQFGWLDVLSKTWGDVAEEWVLARGEMTREFCNGPLGEPWRAHGTGTKASALRIVIDRACESELEKDAIVGPRPRGHVPRGTLWDGLLIGACDVQIDRLEWSVDAIGHGQDWALCPSAVVDWGDGVDGGAVPWEMVRDYTGEDTERPEFVGGGRLVGQDDRGGSTWERVAEALRRSFPVWGDDKMPRRGVDYWLIDSSDRTVEVYGLCAWLNRQPGIGLVHAIKGDESLPDNMLVRWSPAITGVPFDRMEKTARYAMRLGLQLLTLNVNALKTHCFEAMHRHPDHPGAWRWPSPMPDYVLGQLTSEQMVRKKVPGSSGRTRAVWVRKRASDGGGANEHWDMTVYKRGGLSAILEGRGLSAQNAAMLRKWPGEGVSRVGKVGPAKPRMRVV